MNNLYSVYEETNEETVVTLMTGISKILADFYMTKFETQGKTVFIGRT